MLHHVWKKCRKIIALRWPKKSSTLFHLLFFFASLTLSTYMTIIQTFSWVNGEISKIQQGWQILVTYPQLNRSVGKFERNFELAQSREVRETSLAVSLHVSRFSGTNAKRLTYLIPFLLTSEIVNFQANHKGSFHNFLSVISRHSLSLRLWGTLGKTYMLISSTSRAKSKLIPTASWKKINRKRWSQEL